MSNVSERTIQRSATRERAGNLAVAGPEHPNNSFKSYAYCATTKSQSTKTIKAAHWGIYPTRPRPRFGKHPPVARLFYGFNEFRSHGHEPVAGLAGWLTLRRRAMDLARLSFSSKSVAPVYTVR